MKKTKQNHKITKINKAQKVLFTFLLIFTFLFSFSKHVHAQNALSVSISPPITEVMIQPGKEVRQTYILQNNGGDVVLKPRVVYFIPSDNLGNVDLTENEAPDWVKYDQESFNLKFEGQKTFNVVFSPPETEDEIDHYLTLVFETDKAVDLIGQTSSFYKTEIGSNIIVTISKDGNPKKSAEIVKFTAPKIIDSLFGKIDYQILIKNNGNYYWKPNGKININDKTLKIAPFNILSGNERKISCLENEELKDCSYDQDFIIGKVVSNLEFRLDEDSNIYKATTTTYAFPFSLLILVFTLLTIIRIKRIFKL